MRTKSSKYCPPPPGLGAGLWVTHLSSTRRSINRTSYNTLIVLTLPSGLQWRKTRRMVPSPSWTPLSNQRLMVAYPLLCTGNLCIQTSTYSGIAIITSQLNSVSSMPSPIRPKQCTTVLCCSNRKWTTLGRLSLNANILNGLCARWRKGLTSLPVRSLMGLITKVPQVPKCQQ